MPAPSLSHPGSHFPALPLRLQRPHAVARANPALLRRERAMPIAGLAVGSLLLTLMVLWFHQVAAPAPFDCRLTRLPLKLGSESEAVMNVSRGAPCALVVAPGDASVEAMSIEAPPAYGTLRARGRTGVIYQPAAGFAGDDAFAVAFKGRADGKVGTIQVRVRVAGH